MNKYSTFRAMVGTALSLVTGFLVISTASSSPAASYSTALRRYPYLTDVVGPYATINWATDRSESSGGVRYGKVGTESCTAHYVAATETPISVNGVLQYQWKAQLDLQPGVQYCYRVYLGTSPVGEIDLLGSDVSPSFWTQVPSGANESFSFIVIGDWGEVRADGTNPYQASLMSLIAASGARFAVTTGDNGYPSASQKNLGDLVQIGDEISAIFGPSFWKVPGASLPIFPSMGNHGFSSSSTPHPSLLTWPQDRAAATSGGRYLRETYCCLNDSISKDYPSTWYAFDAGPARFYVLHTAWEESNIGTASEYKMDYDYHWAPGTPQYEWLVADLAAHPSVLKFAFFHYPLHSDNPHEATDTFLLGSNGLEGLLKQHSVDIAFTGHAHIYQRNLASAQGVINYITGGGGATPGTLGTCTALDAYAIKFTTSGKACGSAPVPTSPDEFYHFLKVTVNGTNVTVTPINSLGQSFDVQNYNFTAGAETTPPSTPTNLTATVINGTQVDLSWSASSDNIGVRGYGIYQRGTLVDVVDQNTLTYSAVKLSPSTNYSYRVDAFDGSGNHSSLSSSRSATTPDTATYTFVPVADAYVRSEFATTNYGRAVTLRVNGSLDDRSYLRFNVGDLQGAVTSATLRLYPTSSSSIGYQVNHVNNQSWEEGQITYGNAPNVGPVIGSSGSVSSGNWISVDVTTLITGNGIYDLALTTSSSSTLNFRSRNAVEQPQLVIETTANSSTPTPTATPTAGPGSGVTFSALADARVSEVSPTTNYGTTTNLQADGDAGARQTSYIRFDVGGISMPIQSVKLRVFCTTNGTNNGPAVYQAGNSWTESGTGGINWNNQPALLSGVIDNTGDIGTSSWVEFNVTSIVSGNGTYTFALVADGNDGVVFSSREGTAPPQLVVTFGTGVLPASVTPSPTRTPTAAPTATAGSGTFLTFVTEADTRVSEASPTNNYGSATTLLIDSGAGITQNGFVRFTVSGISGTIQTVKLRVRTTTNGTNNGPAVYLVESDWIESGAGGVTWDTQPALLSGAVDDKGALASNTWVEYDVTTLVASNGTYTFVLVADGTDGVTFSSREGTAPPQLVVKLDTDMLFISPTEGMTHTPTPAPAATNTPTSTVIVTDTVPSTAIATSTPVATAIDTATPAITFVPVADARVSEASPTNNYGSATTLLIDSGTGITQNGFIRFMVNDINDTIQTVKLRVRTTTNGTNNGPAVYLAESDWIESGAGGVTWDTQPVLLSDAFVNKGALAGSTWVEYDVTDLVPGNGTYTFALIADGTDGVTFSSRESTTPPQLAVTFAP